METKQVSFRVLMFPWLAHGHVFPYLELAKKLSRKNFQIYFCSTSINLESIKNNFKKNLSHNISIQLVELHLPSLPQLPPQHHTTKNLPTRLIPKLMQAFQMSRSNFSEIITNLKPDLLVYDSFQPWSAKLALLQGISSVHFATSSATTFSFFHHVHTYMNYNSFPHPAIYLREYEKRDLARNAESIKVSDADQDFAFGTFKLSSEIILIKSCRGIEGKYMDYLSDLCGRKVVGLGPLITNANHDDENSNTEIMQWLSQRNQHSTLYISFGSENYLSREQMKEIAKGLELINVNFIWIVQFPTGSSMSIEEELPHGFLEIVKHRGIVVQGWAPQTEILAHKNIGGFMSHCGWSSTTESIYFAVPIVAVPIKMDQPLNSRLITEAGVGVEVRRNDENGEFKAEEVALAINKVIVDQSGEGFRNKVRELREKMKMEEEEAVQEVAEQLSSICTKKLM